MHGVMFIGHSKVAQGSAARHISESLALACIIDPRFGVILEVTSTLMTDSAKHIVSDVLVGRSLIDELGKMLGELRERYHGSSLPAVEAALKDVEAQWRRRESTQSKKESPV